MMNVLWGADEPAEAGETCSGSTEGALWRFFHTASKHDTVHLRNALSWKTNGQ